VIDRVGVVAKSHLTAAASHLTDIAAWLRARGVEPVFDEETAALAPDVREASTATKDELPTRVGMILVLGGDGTLLGMAARIAQAGSDIPMLGVNFGGLGFLTEVTLPELYPSLESAINGSAAIDERLTMRTATLRDGGRVEERIVLNDVVVTHGALSRIIRLSVTADGHLVTRIRADGLIVASPTGSTAYNLSAGGPILHPQVDALVLTPIAPHTLANRPLVVPGTTEIRIEPDLEGSRDDVYLTCDGQFGFPLKAGDVVVVGRAERPLRLIQATRRSYFEVLREKLKWGEA
jgi:NAD+ kinase